MQMLQRYEESMVDLETLLKIDPANSAAKKELQLVLKSQEDEVCIAVTQVCVCVCVGSVMCHDVVFWIDPVFSVSQSYWVTKQLKSELPVDGSVLCLQEEEQDFGIDWDPLLWRSSPLRHFEGGESWTKLS